MSSKLLDRWMSIKGLWTFEVYLHKDSEAFTLVGSNPTINREGIVTISTAINTHFYINSRLAPGVFGTCDEFRNQFNIRFTTVISLERLLAGAMSLTIDLEDSVRRAQAYNDGYQHHFGDFENSILLECYE